MTHVVQIEFTETVTDSGDRTFKVTRREGNSGECPSYVTLHDSHFFEDAKREAVKAIGKLRWHKL